MRKYIHIYLYKKFELEVPSLPPSLLVLALQGGPSLLSAQAAREFSSGTHCRRSASAGEARSNTGGTDKDFITLSGHTVFSPHIMSPPLVGTPHLNWHKLFHKCPLSRNNVNPHGGRRWTLSKSLLVTFRLVSLSLTQNVQDATGCADKLEGGQKYYQVTFNHKTFLSFKPTGKYYFIKLWLAYRNSSTLKGLVVLLSIICPKSWLELIMLFWQELFGDFFILVALRALES